LSVLVALSVGIYWSNVYTWLDLDLEFLSSKKGNMGDEDWKKASSVYDFKYTDIDGNEQSMDRYKGHVLIVANVASKCGFTKANYEQLNELYEKYGESKGLRILGMPSNQFAKQEPGTESEIKEFACTNYKAKFDFSSKVDVNGDNAHPLWKYMKTKQGGFLGSMAKWNFTKFVIDKNGQVVKRYAPTTNPKDMEKDLLKYFEE